MKLLPTYIYQLAFDAGYCGDSADIYNYLRYPTYEECEMFLWGYSDGVNAVLEEALYNLPRISR